MAFVYWIHTKEQVDITSSGYVGITTETVEKRFKKHRSFSKYDKYQHYPICRAIRKYGDEIIVDTLLEGSLDYCLLIENRLRPTPNIGYNVSIGGGSTASGSKHSEETKLLIGAVHKGKIVSVETREKQSSAAKNRPEAHRNKLSIAAKNRSPEHKEKISRAIRGRKHSDEARQKMSLSHKGKQYSLGVKHSEDVKQKWSERRRLWCNSKANPVIWQAACELFASFKAGTSSSVLAKDSGLFDKIKLRSIYKSFNTGWNPNEDQEYLSWLKERTDNVSS